MDRPYLTFSARSSLWQTVACAVALFLPVLLAGCDTFGSDDPAVEYEFDFNTSEHEWEAFFTGYPVGWGEKMELTSDHRPLPDSTELSGRGLFISAVNNSDDVKMLFRRPVNGLEPEATYGVRFTVQFATSAPSGCAGIGGAPGEAVKVLAAASTVRPEPVIEEEPRDYHRLNIQYQNDPQEWQENAIMGHIANSRECEEGWAFEMKELTSGEAHDVVTADESGTAWLLFGTRSGFEGKTSLFYTRLQVELYR